MRLCSVGVIGLVAFTLWGVAWAQVPAGPEFRVNSYTTSRQEYPSVATGPDGEFTVVWVGFNQSGPQSWGIFGQRFFASGAPRGGEFQINTITYRDRWTPHAAVGTRGDFMVVWEDSLGASNFGIQGRRYDSAGNPIGGEFAVNTFTTSIQYGPHVGLASDGRFIVSWPCLFIDDLWGIAARRFDVSGNPIGAPFAVNTYTTGYQTAGDLSVNANGSFVAVWEDRYNVRDGSLGAVFGQRYDGSGNRLGSEFQVNSYTTGRQRTPSISNSPIGGFVVAWTSEIGDGSGHGIFARRFDATGNAVGNDFVVNTYTIGNQSSRPGQVAHDARGNFVITWSGPGDGSSNGVFAQRFSASGLRRGAEFRVNTSTTYAQGRPSVVSDPVGNFVIVWDGGTGGYAGTYTDVSAQRFGGLAPAALTVDSAGNRVLEPGETVDVRPAWRNINGAAQTFSGTLADITGPAGPTYTITDPVGNYGTVANGATAPCIDCYAVSVSSPATRPTVHWDASAVESIVPDSQGQQKQWMLHVGRSFNDVAVASPFYRFVETLLHRGVTGGCSATDYCPANSTSREQMAVFVLVAKEGAGYVPPACGTPVFGDVAASSPFCLWIEELARRGVVGGCGGGNYCPAAAVTREEMAVFVLRTLDGTLNPPACTTPMFSDVSASSPFCRWIEELARRGVVTGCGGGDYCPAAPVTREQMGVFIGVTFGLTLYGP